MDIPDPETYVYVRESNTLASLIRRMDSAERVALDTEADSLHNYFEKVCLIQLSIEGRHYLIDPLSDLDLSGFSEVLAEKPLILHGGDYDLRMLRASLNFRPDREVFDTMIAAQLLGIEQIGLAALIEKYFGIAIAKEGQKSDWSRRPLSEKQLRYAMNDTRFLEALAATLDDELRERERIDWHRESCHAMVESTRHDRLRDPEQAWRIKGSGRLTHRQLAYLRELWHWRDQHARHANVPSFKIFGNEQLLELAQWLDSHPGVPLGQEPKLLRHVRDARLRTLEQAVARVAAMNPAQWPARKKHERPDPLTADMTARLNVLRDGCARIAKDLGIAAAILAPRAALESIARIRPRTVDEIVQSGALLRWQANLIRGAVEQSLHSVND